MSYSLIRRGQAMCQVPLQGTPQSGVPTMSCSHLAPGSVHLWGSYPAFLPTCPNSLLPRGHWNISSFRKPPQLTPASTNLDLSVAFAGHLDNWVLLRCQSKTPSSPEVGCGGQLSQHLPCTKSVPGCCRPLLPSTGCCSL